MKTFILDGTRLEILDGERMVAMIPTKSVDPKAMSMLVNQANLANELLEALKAGVDNEIPMSEWLAITRAAIVKASL